VADWNQYGLQRRVAGFHDIRMDGITDLVIRAKGSSVFDVGMNRGLVAFEFFNNGATVCHGCDSWEPGVKFARELFADFRSVQSKFEVVDLSKIGEMARHFGDSRYDIVLMLATYHKLKRVMPASDLRILVNDFADRTKEFFAWRGTSFQHEENEEELRALDRDLRGLRRVHTSYLSEDLGSAAIWRRL